jgi:hypothetical protein
LGPSLNPSGFLNPGRRRKVLTKRAVALGGEGAGSCFDGETHALVVVGLFQHVNVFADLGEYTFFACRIMPSRTGPKLLTPHGREIAPSRAGASALWRSTKTTGLAIPKKTRYTRSSPDIWKRSRIGVVSAPSINAGPPAFRRDGDLHSIDNNRTYGFVIGDKSPKIDQERKLLHEREVRDVVLIPSPKRFGENVQTPEGGL